MDVGSIKCATSLPAGGEGGTASGEELQEMVDMMKNVSVEEKCRRNVWRLQHHLDITLVCRPEKEVATPPPPPNLVSSVTTQ